MRKAVPGILIAVVCLDLWFGLHNSILLPSQSYSELRPIKIEKPLDRVPAPPAIIDEAPLDVPDDEVASAGPDRTDAKRETPQPFVSTAYLRDRVRRSSARRSRPDVAEPETETAKIGEPVIITYSRRNAVPLTPTPVATKPIPREKPVAEKRSFIAKTVKKPFDWMRSLVSKLR